MELVLGAVLMLVGVIAGAGLMSAALEKKDN